MSPLLGKTGSNAEVLSLAMRSGWWNCAKEHVTKSSKGSGSAVQMQALLNHFDLEQRTITKNIQDLKAAIQSSMPMSLIVPALQWAQSTEHIFLNVKFAHKLDAPATLNVETSIVNVTSNRLVLEASDGRKNFILDLAFLREIVPEDASTSWQMASVGRMTFTLRKADAPSRWKGLLSGPKHKGQMQLWFEIAEKYSRELDRLEEKEEKSSKTKDKDNKKGNKALEEGNEKKNIEGEQEEEESGGGDGAIVSEEEESKKKRKRDIVEELKSQLEELEREIKKRKRDVDFELVEKKKKLDQEAANAKQQLDEEGRSRREALEKSSFASLADVKEL